MSQLITIFDTTLRDGEQAPGCQLSTAEKVEIACMLESLGVDVIEAGFPISSPGDFASVQAVSKAVQSPVVCALTRARTEDIDAAVAALQFAKRARIHTGIGASDIHIRHKFRTSREDIVERAVHAVGYAKRSVEDVEFYAEDAGRADNAFLARLVQAVIGAGATVVNIPDTTGYCLPTEFADKITYLFEHVNNIHQATVSVHCHNDLGLATANTVAAITAGARQVEVTVNGVGERAGNTALEEIAMVIATRRELGARTNINTPLIGPVSRLVADRMSQPVAANKSIVGANAFAHSSGIHQDGMLKASQTYEIIDPQSVGMEPTSIVLSSRSGRAALGHHLSLLGYDLPGPELDACYRKFLALCDVQKHVTESDLHAITGQAKVGVR